MSSECPECRVIGKRIRLAAAGDFVEIATDQESRRRGLDVSFHARDLSCEEDRRVVSKLKCRSQVEGTIDERIAVH